MQKRNIVILLAALLALFLAPGASAVGPAAASDAYVIVDADTGQVLLGANMDTPMNPASTTKVMTMALACNKAAGDWSTQLTVSHDAVYSLYKTDSSHIALQEGEVVTLADMLYAAEMVSANDAVNVLAEYVGGSIEGGVDAMNALAVQLGLQNTHFANPHGITNSEHLVSCSDMATILRWGLAQPGFEDLFCETEMYTMQPTNLQPDVRYFALKDYMRLPYKQVYVESIRGSKTGYTDAARYTYVCLAEQDDKRLICVLMHSQLLTEKFDDIKMLLNYAFSNFSKVEIPSGAASAKMDVAGGGASLGQLDVSSPAATLLLAEGLTAENVTVTLDVPAQYVLGQDCTANAVYAVDGAGVQESTAVTEPVAIAGLEPLLQANAGRALDTSRDTAPEKPLLPWLAALCGAAVAAIAALWRTGRLKKLCGVVQSTAQNVLRRLHKTEK